MIICGNDDYLERTVSKFDTLHPPFDTFRPLFEIPLILPADTMIMLEVKEQQDKYLQIL